MIHLCSAVTAADKTNALAAGNSIAEMSLQQWVGNVGSSVVEIMLDSCKKRSPPKWRKCESFRGNCLRGWRPERAMDRMDRPRTSIDERMLSGRLAVMIV